MSDTLTSSALSISETGLKLIKAFEGYRPVDRELITGQRIVGYGHRLYSDTAVIMNKSEAEATLRADLEPFEDMINTEVHAPITQSQFDALCSFAFNIGPKAFLESDTLRALNNGRPLDAANGLDIWRKSEIAGKTYVVDALMRRRTAEKALFLRTERDLTAGREDLPPVKDTTIVGLSTEDALPVFTAEDANGVVATAPYDAYVAPMRRREDGPAGALELSELDIIEDEVALSDLPDDVETLAQPDKGEADASDDIAFESEDTFDVAPDDDADMPIRPSPIAAAATDIVARLDALIEDADARFEDRGADWPESLITAEGIPEDAVEQTEEDGNNVVDLYGTSDTKKPTRSEIGPEFGPESDKAAAPATYKANPNAKPVAVIDELAQDDAFRMRSDSAAKYIQKTQPMPSAMPVIDTRQTARESALGLWIPVLLGFLLVGLAGGAMIAGSEALLGAWGPIMAFTGFVIGVGLILAGVYAALRMNLRN